MNNKYIFVLSTAIAFFSGSVFADIVYWPSPYVPNAYAVNFTIKVCPSTPPPTGSIGCANGHCTIYTAQTSSPVVVSEEYDQGTVYAPRNVTIAWTPYGSGCFTGTVKLAQGGGKVTIPANYFKVKNGTGFPAGTVYNNNDAFCGRARDSIYFNSYSGTNALNRPYNMIWDVGTFYAGTDKHSDGSFTNYCSY